MDSVWSAGGVTMDGASGMAKSNGGLGAGDRHSFDIVFEDQSKSNWLNLVIDVYLLPYEYVLVK